ncbi:MAG: TolB family protein [Promethearchaeota archaeon]
MQVSVPRQLTSSDHHHFFGYYEISPWSANGRYFVCLEADFQNHMPRLGEKARILLLDLKENTQRVITETQAWNFQQGAMLHWLPSAQNTKIIFNDCGKEGLISQVLDIQTEEEYSLPLAINGVAHTKDKALCVNFARLKKNRPVTSYPCKSSASGVGSHPKDDGAFLMDLQTGDSELIISLYEIWNRNEITRTGKGMPLKARIFGTDLWFNHLGFSPDDKRFFFLARFTNWFRSLVSSMWIIGVDGSDPFLAVDFKHEGQHSKLSHFGWKDNNTLIVTMKYLTETKHSHVLIKDKEGEAQVIAPKKLTWDGHPAFSPDKRYVATDTYLVKGKRYLYIVDLKTGEIHEVASFRNPLRLYGRLRCDPHPRWSPDGSQLSFDGLGENGRQVYVIDIT